MNPIHVSPEVQKPEGFSQKDLSNKKTTKSLLQKIVLLIPPFFIFVARRFYPIGLKLSCALALIGSSLIYLFQKVFSGKNRKQIDTSKTQKTLEHSNIGVDSKQKERKEELDQTKLIQALGRRKENDLENRDLNPTQKTLKQLNIRVDGRKKERQEELDQTKLIQALDRRKENDLENRDLSLTQKTLKQLNIGVDSKQKERKEKLDQTELIQVLGRRKENDPKNRDQNLRGTAFEIWLLRNYGAFLKEFGISSRISIPKMIKGLEERGKDVGDERFDLVTKLGKKVFLDVSLLCGYGFERLFPFMNDAEILIVILENEKNDLTHAKLALAILEGPLQNCTISIDAFVLFLSFLKKAREAGKTEEQMNQAVLKVLEDKGLNLLRKFMISGEGMIDFCKAVEQKMGASLLK